MKSQDNPTFALPELQQAIDEARPLLEGAEAAKNRVSKEIKALENYLQGLNLKHEFRYQVSVSQCAVGNDAAASLEYSGTASALMEEEERAAPGARQKGNVAPLLRAEILRWRHRH